MANAEREEGDRKRRRVDNIITIQEGDSQESLEEVSNFYF